MKRRTVLAGAGVTGLAGLSGCLGLIGMDEHESSPAGIDGATRESTGYEQVGIDEVSVERDVGIGPLSSEVSVRNYVTEHDKSIEMPGPLGERRGAVFMVLSTPKVGLLGRNFNPVEDMSAEELFDLVTRSYGGISDVETEAETELEVLDKSTTQTRFSSSAEFDGQDVDIYTHVSEAVETDDDLIVTIGIYPQMLRSQEESNVLDLMASVVEEADPDDTVDPDDSDELVDGVGDALWNE